MAAGAGIVARPTPEYQRLQKIEEVRALLLSI
jgi:hypothetical protein